MYQSPIEMLITDIQHQFVKQQDEAVYKAVLHYIPNVDKAELLRALQYDRGQYEKGYFDGKEDATPKWIPVSDGLLPDGERRIVVRDGDYYEVLKFNGNYWVDGNGWLQDICEFTHWMTLPEPPEEGA